MLRFLFPDFPLRGRTRDGDDGPIRLHDRFLHDYQHTEQWKHVQQRRRTEHLVQLHEPDERNLIGDTGDDRVIALLLEANPNLTWRDVKHI